MTHVIVPLMFLVSWGNQAVFFFIIHTFCIEDGKQVSRWNVKKYNSNKKQSNSEHSLFKAVPDTWSIHRQMFSCFHLGRSGAPFGQYFKRRRLNTFMRCSILYAKPSLYKSVIIWWGCVCVCWQILLSVALAAQASLFQSICVLLIGNLSKVSLDLICSVPVWKFPSRRPELITILLDQAPAASGSK